LFDGKKNGSHELWKNITEDEAETAKEMLRATVMEAAGKMAGSVPGGLIQEIEAAWEEVINWKAALRYFYQSVIANYNVYSRTVRDRRRGLDVPGPKKGYSCRLLFCIDTSGSMSDNDLAHVISECRHLGKILKIDADVLQFDYGLQDFCEINKFVAAKKFKGRGGTSFQPPFDFAQNKKFRIESLTKMGKTPKTKKYDGVVIYTDGYAEKPRLDIPLKILWLMTPGNKKTSDWPGREVEVKIPKGK
jgi:predicted metal-dependent peptidase